MSEIISGTNLVKAAIIEGVKLDSLLILNDNKEFKKFADQLGVKYKIVDKLTLDKMANNHQGVVATITEFKVSSLDDIIIRDKNSLIVLLDGLEDPHNLGAILRTCDAAGVAGVILPKNRSVKLNSTVARVSTGAIFSVKCVEVVNLASTMDRLKKEGYWIVGAEAIDRSQDYRKLKYNMPTVLVIGSEGKGISRLVSEKCDFLVKIPMLGKVNSLNASVSAGILIYEIIKDQ